MKPDICSGTNLENLGTSTIHPIYPLRSRALSDGWLVYRV